MPFGQTLRAAREAKGLSTSELAAQTHLLVQVVEGLENEDFRRIPAPIYGRGFVKLYCETVGLDPKPLQAEFMALYNQKKDAPAWAPPPPKPAPVAPPPPTPEVKLSAEPVIAPTPEPKPEAEPEPAPESAPVPPAEPKSETVPEPAPAPDPKPVSPQPRRSYGELFEQTYAAVEPQAKPTPAEKFHDTMSNVSSGVFATVKRLPPNTGRIATVAAVALILLIVIVWGISELYKATNGTQTPETAPTQTVQTPAAPTETAPKTTETKAKTATKSKGLKASGVEVPSLYID